MSEDLNRKIDKAITLYEQGNLKKSLKHCLKLLKKTPTNPQLLITLGNIFYIQNNYAKATEYYQQAVDLAPFNYPALANLANSFFEQKIYPRAVEYARRAVECRKEEKLGYVILGNSYQEMNNFDSAVKYLEEAARIDPSDSWTFNYLSQAYAKQENYLKAIASAWKAVTIAKEEREAHHINLGYLFYEVALEKDVPPIAECIKLWLKKYSDDPVVNYMGNALLGNQKIKIADAKYLQDIFDVFSSDFDEVLHGLDYMAPQLIGKKLEKIYKGKKNPRLKILDIGCGTGLCGAFLKKYAGWFGLDGVDLSSKMLAAAKQKKIYSRLINADMISYMNACPNKYDLMTAADVFTYVGDLEDVIKAVHKSLRKKGRIIFTVTENFINDKPYYLHISGRFIHSVGYVKFLLNNNLFEIESCERKKLRREGENFVSGYIVSAIKK